MEKTEIMKRFIHQAVITALINSRLNADHPMRDVLESEAQVVGEPGRGCVRVLDHDGSWLL